MGKAAKEWARRARANLMQELGALCKWCGTTEDLTFDCIIPTGDAHHRGSTDQRMCFYRIQHRDWQNVQVLCASCNAKKSDSVSEVRPEMNWQHLGVLQPF